MSPVKRPSAVDGLRRAAAVPAETRHDMSDLPAEIRTPGSDLPAEAPKRPKRPKPVRITVDLTPEQYRTLNEWTSRAAADLDVPRLTLADAIRAMAKVTAIDSGISAVVVDMIRRDKEQ